MSVIKEFIMFAAGIVITVSLAAIGFNIYSEAAELGKGIAGKERSAIEELREYELMRFDGSEVDGSRAISYIKRIYRDYDIPIEVTGNGRSYVIDGDSIGEIRNTSSVYYMNPLRKYLISVSVDENDAASGITIEQRR